MKTLPVAGAQLVRFRFAGNGKDSEATIEAEGARKAVIPLNDATMDIVLVGPITVRTRGRGDTEVSIEIVPAPNQPVTIDEATVQFPGDDDDWNESFRRYADTGELSWCVALRLRLVTSVPDHS